MTTPRGCPAGDPCPGTGCPACCPEYDPCGEESGTFCCNNPRLKKGKKQVNKDRFIISGHDEGTILICTDTDCGWTREYPRGESARTIPRDMAAHAMASHLGPELACRYHCLTDGVDYPECPVHGKRESESTMTNEEARALDNQEAPEPEVLTGELIDHRDDMRRRESMEWAMRMDIQAVPGTAPKALAKDRVDAAEVIYDWLTGK